MKWVPVQFENNVPMEAAGELLAANLSADMLKLRAAQLTALVPPAGPLLLAPLLAPGTPKEVRIIGHQQIQKFFREERHVLVGENGE